MKGEGGSLLQKDLLNIVDTYALLKCPGASFKTIGDIFNTVPAAPLAMTALQTSFALGLGVRAAIVGRVQIGNITIKTVLDEHDNMLVSIIPDYNVRIDKGASPTYTLNGKTRHAEYHMNQNPSFDAYENGTQTERAMCEPGKHMLMEIVGWILHMLLLRGALRADWEEHAMEQVS